MALTAEQWHILSICLFPVMDAVGIAFAVVLAGRKNKMLLSSGILFSAGVLLSGAFVHMLPHSTEIIAKNLAGDHDEEHDVHSTHEEEESGEEGHSDEVVNEYGQEHESEHNHQHYRHLEEDEHSHTYPWSSLIFALAFLFLLIVESSIERLVDKYFGVDAHFLHNDDDGHRQTDRTTTSAKTTSTSVNHSHDVTGKDCIQCDSEIVRKMEEEVDDEEAPRIQQSGGTSKVSPDSIDTATPAIGETWGWLNTTRRRTTTWAVTAPRPSVLIGGAPNMHEDQQQTINPWVAILLTLVLCIHVVIEGMTIGSSTDTAMLRSIFIAVAVHKCFSAFSLGSSLIASGYWDKDREGGCSSRLCRGRTMFFVLSTIFICMDILGVGIGIALANHSDSFSSNGLGSGVMLALLGGSFLFVAAVELIPGEFEKMRVFKLPIIPLQFSLLAGFGLMSLVGNWV